MAKAFSLGLIVALVALGVPPSAFAGPARGPVQNQQQTGGINGIAKSAKGDVLPGYKVRVRKSATGAIVAETVADGSGAFSVAGLAPASYVVEVINAAGQVVGLSSAVAVTAGTVATVTVTATAAGTVAAAAAGGGFGILGLGAAATTAIIAGAAAIGLAAAIAVNNQASPSR